MSGLFGGASKATTHTTRAMGMDFQGAQYGPVIPVVYGRNKVSGNCLWYGDFQSHAQQQKQGKGGGGGGTTNYTYSASAQMGLCEGPGIALRTVYDGTSVVNLSSINYAFASGAIGQAPWSHLSGSAALGYSLTAIFSFQNLDLGSQASLPNYNYEVDALKQFSGSIPDANPKDIVSDICSDPYHGVSFPYLGDLTQYSNYCVANGLFLSPVYDQQQSANQALTDLFNYTNAYVYYSEDQLKVVPLGDTAVTGNGVTFTPNVTPVVNLGTDDFLADGSGATITVDRKAPQDNLNLVRVEFKDRSNTYHDSAAVAAIDEDIITNGGRSDDSETVNGCTTAAVARFIAQNLVQRAFYIRNTYQFKLSWRYCYLEPTDIVTLTDASLGLSLYPVRITETEEDGDSALTITAEEFPEGIGHSAIYDTQPNGGTNIDQNADPGAVNPPFLFRGPGFLVGNNTPEIWCAVNGSNAMWAGCEVYLSHDGSSYTFAGAVASQARYGSLNAALAAGTTDPDTTNTPTAQLYAPGQLLGGSQTDADNFVTLAMIDSEIIAYETATLAAANTYTLGYLRRGGYGSSNVAHTSGAPFVRLDDSIFRIPVDPSLIGSTVYLKFLSINAFGRTPRTLAEETAYTYVVGTNVELPDVPPVPDNFLVQAVADGVSITWTNDNPAATGCTSIEYAAASGGPFTVLAQVGPTTTSFHHAFTSGNTYYYRARARGPLVQSGWSAYTTALSSAGVNVTGTGGFTTIATTASNLAQQVNVINPGFDAGDVGWIKDPGWTIKTDSAGPGAGVGYAQFNPTGSNGAIKNKALCFVTVGQTYKAQALIRASGANGSGYAKIAWLDASLNVVGSNAPGAVVTGTQTAGSSVVAQAPAGAVYGQVWIEVDGCTTGTYQADNVVSTLQPSSLSEVPDGGGRYAAVQSPSDQIVTQALATASQIPGANLIYNSMFALKSSGYQQFDADWQVGTGQYGLAAQISMTGTARTEYIISNDIPCTPGSPLSIALDYLIQNTMSAGDMSADVQFKNSAGTIIGGWPSRLFQSGAATGTFTHVATPNIIPIANAAFARLRVYVENATGTGAAFLRRLKCEYGATCTPFNDETTQAGNQLTVAGSGQQIGDARQLPPTNTMGVSSVLSTSPVTYTISGTTVTFSAAAFSVYNAGVTIPYSAASCSVTQAAGTTVTYYLYFSDPAYAGNAQTMHATTSIQTMAQSAGVVNIANATVTVNTGGGGTGGGGTGGGGWCVADDMFIGDGRRAGDAEIGDPFDCIDLPTDAGKHVRALQGVSRGIEECVRMITSDGCALVCSVSTPFDLLHGRNTTAPHMLGEQVITDLGTASVISVALVGPRPVTRAHLGGVSYAAGADPHRRIYSHNAGTSKP